jgi:hypothetical protein
MKDLDSLKLSNLVLLTRIAVKRKKMSDEIPSIKCPTCHGISYNSNDIKYKYCVYCHEWHEFMKDFTDIIFERNKNEA